MGRCHFSTESMNKLNKVAARVEGGATLRDDCRGGAVVHKHVALKDRRTPPLLREARSGGRYPQPGAQSRTRRSCSAAPPNGRVCRPGGSETKPT